MQTLICVYCGKSTTRSEHLVHIAPESTGCRATLYPGAVCTKCNRDLGVSVDAKVFNEPMMAMGQVASGAKGKRGVRKNINSGRGTVSKTATGVEIVNTMSGKSNEFVMSRFLAKIAVNQLTQLFGSAHVRLEYPTLIKYVRSPKSKKDIWPYYAVYTVLKPIGKCGVGSKKTGIIRTRPGYNFVWFICASGLFSIPLDRTSERAFEEAQAYIDSLVENQKRKNSNKTRKYC